MNQLAGGLSVRRAYWLVLRRQPWAFWPSFSEWRGRPERVTEQHQVELFNLVRLCAGRLGITMPNQVRLVGTAEVTMRVGRWRRTLLLGLPLIDGLTGPELSALIAHELSATGQPHPVLTGRLLAACRAAHDDVDYRTLRGRTPKRRDAALLATTAAWYRAVEQAADQAAALVTDRSTAARAVTLGCLLADDFDIFLIDSSADQLAKRGYAIDDLDAGWLQRLSAVVDDPDTGWDEEYGADLAARHPGLADELAALGRQRINLALPASRIVREPMTRRVRRRLVRQALSLDGQKIYRWRTFQQAPDRYRRKDIATRAQHIRIAVLEVLDIQHASPATIADTILRRPTDVAASLLKRYAPPGIDAQAPDDQEPAPLLAPFIEAILYERGWRRDQPLIEGVLTGPDGQHIDCRRLAARVAADPFALAELHRLLAIPQPSSSSPRWTASLHSRACGWRFPRRAGRGRISP